MAIANFSCSQQWYGGMMMGDQQGIRPGTYSMIDFRMPAILTGINKVNLTVHTSFGTPTVAIYFYSGTCTGAMCTTHMEIDVNGVGQSYDNVPVYSSFWKAAGTWRVTNGVPFEVPIANITGRYMRVCVWADVSGDEWLYSASGTVTYSGSYTACSTTVCGPTCCLGDTQYGPGPEICADVGGSYDWVPIPDADLTGWCQKSIDCSAGNGELMQILPDAINPTHPCWNFLPTHTYHLDPINDSYFTNVQKVCGYVKFSGGLSGGNGALESSLDGVNWVLQGNFANFPQGVMVQFVLSAYPGKYGFDAKYIRFRAVGCYVDGSQATLTYACKAGCTNGAQQTTTCPDGSTMVTANCTNYQWVPTGLACPVCNCVEGTYRSPTTCWDGSVIQQEVCHTCGWTSSGQSCPACGCTEGAFQAPVTCWDGSIIYQQVCHNCGWTPTSQACPACGCTEGALTNPKLCADGKTTIYQTICHNCQNVASGQTCPACGCTEGALSGLTNCWDGTKIYTKVCHNCGWISTGKTCPPLPAKGYKMVIGTCSNGSPKYQQWDGKKWVAVTCPRR